VQFQQQQLYDHYESPTVEQVPEAVIFSDAQGSLWHSLFTCGDFKITNETAYSGKNSIKLSWDKSKGCEWLGFGNSFSNWSAVDLSEERNKKALTFFVRTQEKSSGAVTIVANLEDFGGGGSYLYLDTKKYLDGLNLDTNWKQMIVPLWDFPLIEEEFDIRAIKQVKFQLEGGGSFYLDEIRLIDYSPQQYQEFRKRIETLKPKGEPKQLIFKPEEFEFSVWNAGKTACQDLNLVTQNNKKILSWDYNAEKCSWAQWGINWNGWYQVNFRGITEISQLEFSYRTNGNFKIYLEDFRGNSKEIFQAASLINSETEWLDVRLPLSKMELEKSGFALDQIKQLRFEGIGTGHTEIQEIKLSKLR